VTATLAGKVVAITGATSGIGRACALACAREGADVVVTGRNAARGESVVEQIRRNGGRGSYVRQDVTLEDDWGRTVDAVRERHGRLDALVNNAGESINKPIGQLSPEDFWFLLRINFEACFLGMRACLPLISASGGGTILNVSSVAALRGGPGGTIYGPSKAAMTGLSMAAAAEGARLAPPVRVNALHPGFIWGEGPVESLGEEGARQFRERIVARTPLRRVGEVDDIAGVVVYLLSDDARQVSGQELVVDGGLALSFP
jgi:NAD(P)-dependent dehydrogenase (short-subunit alcohol dehydrogenase family)